jgi:F-type H+-transporting ATPase subunit a
MNVWPFLNAASRLITCALVALLAWLAIINSPLWPSVSRASDAEQQETNVDSAHGATPTKAHHDPNALEHVMDSYEWHLFMSPGLPQSIHLPWPFSKFVILEIIAALLVCAVYIPLARKVQSGGVTRGAYGNFFEVLLTFIRDQVAKPGIGEHDADRFVPFLWTLFLFILFNNLLGMVPFGGSATGSIFVTLGLAIVVFGYMHGNGIARMGLKHYVLSLWPNFDVPFPLGYVIKPLIFVIEWFGIVVRNVVLAVRLCANMFAGHMVTATFLIFIWMARFTPVGLWASVTVSSVAGIVALSLLDLFVAFLQAYIFTFLTALFMGMALHPEH